MFDIGGWEFLVIVVVAIVVIGPKDLPAAIRTVSGWIRRARELAREFQSGLDDLAREAELEDLRNDFQSGLGFDEVKEAGESLRREIEHSIDPAGEIARSFEDDPLPVGLEDGRPDRPDTGSAEESEPPRTGEEPDHVPRRADQDAADATRKA